MKSGLEERHLFRSDASKDDQGRLRVGAAVDSSGDGWKRAMALIEEKGVDALVVDTAHGHSLGVCWRWRRRLN